MHFITHQKLSGSFSGPQFCEIVDYHCPEIPHTWLLPLIRGLPFPRSSNNTPILLSISNNDSKCCCSGNKHAKMYNIHCRASLNDFMQGEEKKICCIISLNENSFRNITKILY